MNKYELPTNITFTEEQIQAIMDDNQNILVSAAAGCGKTTLLVERIIRKIISDNVNINQLVVVTFTEAAASELKQRLENELNTRLSKDPSNTFLAHQLEIINDTYIMTFHSLCMRLLSENQLAFKFDKPLKISDKIELESLKFDTYTKLFDEYIIEDDFYQIHDYYNSVLDNKPLYNVLINLIDMCTNKSSLTSFIKSNDQNASLSFYNLFDLNNFNNLLIESSNYYINNIINLCLVMQTQNELPKVDDLLNTMIDDMKGLLTHVSNTNYNALHHELKAYKLFRKPAKMDDHLKKIHDSIKKDYLDKLKDLYQFDETSIALMINNNYENSAILLKYALLLDNKLRVVKQANGILEFNDLEQYTLSLLYDNDNFSSVALNLQEHFNEIMIDEYQDTNLIQEKIVRALSNNHNMFMVGDLKQSIYRFRNATSQLFSDKYYEYSNGLNGKVINLSFNFRSKDEVLEMTNYVFKNSFSKDIGGIDYDENAQLYFKNKALDNFIGDFRTSLLLNTNLEAEDESKIDVMDASAQMIVTKIKELINQGQKYQDIAILFRSRTKVSTLETLLSNNDIPYMLHGSSGFYSVLEIKDIISILQLISDQSNDIALLSVLRSFFFNFNENDLLNLTNYEGYSLFEKLKNSQYVETYNLLKSFINYQNYHNVLELINYIYQESSYLSYYLKQHDYQKFLININMFKDIINTNYDYFNNLDYFMKQIATNLKANFDNDLPAILSSNQNVVNLMTIHKSKGLEFKYVFILDISKYRFTSRNDVFKQYNNQLVLDYFNIKDKTKQKNILSSLINFDEKKDIIAEELRILYVALTRAKLKLYITANLSLEQIANYHARLLNEPAFLLSNNVVMNYSSNIDPIILSMLRHRNGITLRDGLAMYEHDEIYNYFGNLFAIEMFEIKDNLATTLLNKKTNYAFKQVEPLANEVNNITKVKPSHHNSNLLDFTTITNYDSYALGNAVHKVLELIDFKGSNLESQIQSLALKFNLNNVMTLGIIAFTKDPFFNKILNNDYAKEYSFNYLDNDKLINGIIDILVETENSIYIIDYKSDKKSNEDLLMMYKDQLITYQNVLSNSSSKPIKGLIYSIRNQSFINVF